MATAAILRLPTSKVTRVSLDEGPTTIAFVAQQIRLSGLHYKDIAKRTGVTARTVSAIACGERKLPRLATVVNIALALGWEIEAVQREQ